MAAERNVDGAALAEAAVPAFARHLTYPPRYGWLEKGFAGVIGDPGIFTRPDATVLLGTGSSMVPAIRYWMSAFGLTEERGRGHTVPTWEAQWLLSGNGADPWLEDPASLWLLHWFLLSPLCIAPTWWITFNTMFGRFDAGDLARRVAYHAGKAGWAVPSRDSVERDVSCLTRMYGAGTPGGAAPGIEDLLNCPFRELGLLQETAAGTRGREWRLAAPGRRAIPDAVVAFACLDYAGRHQNGGPGLVSLARLASEPGAPGRAFLLSRDNLTDALRGAAARFPALSVTELGDGQETLAFSCSPRELAWDILDSHYDGVRARVPTRAQWTARFPLLGQGTRRVTPAAGPGRPATRSLRRVPAGGERHGDD